MATLKERLRARLGLDTSEFDKGLDRSGKKVKAFGADAQKGFAATFSQLSGLGKAALGGLGLGIATAGLQGIVSSARETVSQIAAIGDEAKRSGLGLQAFQEWKFVAEQNRIGIDALVDGFKELNLRADEWIVTGGGSASEAFQRLGFTAEDLKRKLKDPSALMLEIIGRLKNLDRAAQIRISDELFGGTGGEQFVQLLERGEAGVRKDIAAAHEFGAVMDREMIGKADELNRKWQAVSSAIGRGFKVMAVGAAEFAAELSGLSADLDELLGDEGRARTILGNDAYEGLKKNRQAVEDNRESIEGLDQAIVDLQWAANQMAVGLADAARDAGNLGKTDLDAKLMALAEEMNSLQEQFNKGEITGEQLASRLVDVRDRANEAFAALSEADKVSMDDSVKNVGKLEKALMSAAGMAQSLAGWLANAAGIDLGTVKLQPDDRAAAIAEARAGRLPVSVQEADSNSPRPKAAPPMTHELTKPTTSGGKAGGTGGSKDEYAATIKQTREEIAALEAESVAFLAAAKSGQSYANIIEFARKKAELLAAAQKEGKKITPELAAEIDKLAESYAVAANGAGDAQDKIDEIRDASARGADAVTGIFSSILTGAKSGKEAVIELLAQMALIQAQKGLLGLFGGNSGFLGALGSMLTVGANANGTTNWQGGLSLVGERGAELVSMPRGAQVFSHADTRRMLGGSGGIRDVNVSVGVDPDTGNLTAFVDRRADLSSARVGAQINAGLPARVQQIQMNPRRR